MVKTIKTNKKKRYTFAFYTGYGYRGISPHTVETYYLHVNAEDETEAIEKLIKSASRNLRYNNCFDAEKCGIEINNKIGILFIKDKIIRWCGDKVYKGSQVFGRPPYEQKLSSTKYIFDGNWVVNTIFNDIYPTYEAYTEYVYDYMNHDAFGETAEERLKKYYYPLIKEK